MRQIPTSSRNPTIQAPPKAGPSALGSSGSSMNRPTRTATTTAAAATQSTSRVAKLRQSVNTTKSKPTRRKDSEEVYQRCLDLLREADQDTEQLKEKMNKERRDASRSLQRLRDETDEQLRLVTTEKETALGRTQELEEEVYRLRQEIDTLNADNEDKVACKEIYPVFKKTHMDLLSAAGSVWSTLDALQNKHMACFLPGSNVFNTAWPSQTAQLGAVGASSLPDHPIPTTNVSADAQQSPTQLGQYTGLSSEQLDFFTHSHLPTAPAEG